MSDAPKIRRASEEDLPALLDIYNYYIRETPITFDIEEQTLEQRKREWFDAFTDDGRYQCFVAVDRNGPIGWACTRPYRPKRAYETSAEVSIYLKAGAGGQGTGRRLYQTLFAAVRGADLHRFLGGVTLPNPASLALHKSLGFTEVGTYHAVGRKFGRFWDVTWFERPTEL